MIFGSEKKKVTEKLAQYFWGEFQRNHCSKLIINLFLGSPMKSRSRLLKSNIILYDLSPTIALSYHWLTDLKMPTKLEDGDASFDIGSEESVDIELR